MLWVCVYLIINDITCKIYIGQRKYTHNYRDKNYFGSGKLLKNSIKKYGKENFTKIILLELDSQDELDYFEELYIKKYNSLYPQGYNISETPWGGAYLSNHPDKELIKEKISKSLKGYKYSEERNLKVSKALKGRKRSEETKDKIFKTKLNNPNPNIWNKGKKARRIKCPHCGRDIAYNLFNKWHGDNCKQNENRISK